VVTAKTWATTAEPVELVPAVTLTTTGGAEEKAVVKVTGVVEEPSAATEPTVPDSVIVHCLSAPWLLPPVVLYRAVVLGASSPHPQIPGALWTSKLSAGSMVPRDSSKAACHHGVVRKTRPGEL
jgi:hypothetical protein